MLGLLLIRPSWDTDKPVWASNIPTLYARSQEWYWSESSTKKTTHRQTSLQQRLLCAPCWQETWHWVLPVQLFHRHWATETTQSRARSSSVIIIHCSKTAWKYIYTTQSFVLWPPPMHRASTSCLDCTLVIGILWRYLVKLPKQPFWIWGWTHKAQESTKADHRCVGCRRAYKICQDG